jgi:hypothetical protein
MTHVCIQRLLLRLSPRHLRYKLLPPEKKEIHVIIIFIIFGELKQKGRKKMMVMTYLTLG